MKWGKNCFLSSKHGIKQPFSDSTSHGYSNFIQSCQTLYPVNRLFPKSSWCEVGRDYFLYSFLSVFFFKSNSRNVSQIQQH